MGQAFYASTSAIDPADRINFWNAGSSRIGGVRAEAKSNVFDAEVTLRRIDSLTLYRLSSTPHRVEMNPLAGDGGRMLRLRYQQDGHSIVFQGQQKVELHPGDWMMVDPHQSHLAINEGDVSHLWLQVPCNDLPFAASIASRCENPLLPLSQGASGALYEAIVHAIDAPGQLACEEEVQLGRQLTDLFRRVLRQSTQASLQLTSLEQTARRARNYIDRNLHDPELSVDQVARALGCTPRYIHKAFQGSESVCRYIWNRRLDLCRSKLERQPLQPTTLTALAFDCGFNSSSHFSRSFRERFGTSPSSFVAALQRGSS